MTIIETDRWMEAPLDIEVVDVWQPGRFSDAAMDAYDKLARAGRIRPVSAHRDATGRTVVRYMADCPEAWIRVELREAKYAGKQMNMNEVSR